MSVSAIKKIINAWENWDIYFENPLEEYFNPDKKTVQAINGIKKWQFLRHVPDHYWPPWSLGYALIRWINCQGRCHYCYLQSYYKSPDVVQFKNIEDYISFLKTFLDHAVQKYPDTQIIFYDWDFQDSLWYYQTQQNIEQINALIDLFEQYPNVYLEIRTKCIMEKKAATLEDRFSIYKDLKISSRCIYAITFSPQEVISVFEPWTATLDVRLAFADYLVGKGARLWIRMDPLIHEQSTVEHSMQKYQEVVRIVSEKFTSADIYNWAFWVLRLKDKLYKQLHRQNSPLTTNLVNDWNFYRYAVEDREKMYSLVRQSVNHHNVYICMDEES